MCIFLSFAGCIVKYFMKGGVVTSSRSPPPLKTISAFTHLIFRVALGKIINSPSSSNIFCCYLQKQLKPRPLFHHKNFYQTQVDDVIITQFIARFFHYLCNMTNHHRKGLQNTKFHSGRPKTLII